jgi:hypothetical protein
MYCKFLQENEQMLKKYDTVLSEKEDQLRLYKNMLAGDFSHLHKRSEAEDVDTEM